MRDIIEVITELGEEFKSGTIKFTQKLIQTPSISSTEKAVSDLILSEMRKLEYDEYFRDDMGNIVGIVKGTEPGPTIMYNSHLDHVSPGDVNNWEGYDPYGGEIDLCEVNAQDKSVTEIAECIHGRAASDVKAGEAAQIYAGGILARLKYLGYGFKGNYMFTGVVQEEPAEMVGMIHLIDKTFPAKGINYDAMVSSEATSLKIYCGHRGRVEFLSTIYGRTCHGSSPWLGVNSIYKAIPLISKIKDELYPSLPCDDKLGKASISINIIECSPGALSIIPDKCMLSIDRRTIPGETAETSKAEIEKLIHQIVKTDPEFKASIKVKAALEKSYTGVEYEAVKDMSPWKIAEDHPFVLAAAEGLKEVGQTVKYGYWEFGTDASKTAGIDRKPTIGYSPMQEQYAHTPYDKVRTDFISKALIGNVAIFLKVIGCEDKAFEPLKW
ncbi:M20/M25/M40 family metallo-hydrolase [Clostridium algoriphilum]|uniref:M20/M25/M40 family metallo-hydrolase n=1 Tax=Clostridium algoriphilum TaxID=198347 RepID=UPI001CF3F0BE|nr:M20/M25/M40 family metallo-hydrolase [Clostridium algoriphilum]MCB2294111.1 M20/M25/M40 family metallo-hydrolase [Clostridium algoriphilum]